MLPNSAQSIGRVTLLAAVLLGVAPASSTSALVAQELQVAEAPGEAPAPAPAEAPPAEERVDEAASRAGDADRAPGEQQPSEGTLDSRQEVVARRFKQFEKTLLQMGEYLRKTEPDRADLLFRARSRGQEVRVAQQMEQIIELLKNEQFGDAVERQAELVKHLREMLELLQSEDRRTELEKEKERIQGLIKELNKNIAGQKDVRAQTERGGDPDGLSDKQLELAERTGKLGEKIDRQDAERNGENLDEKKSREGKSQQSKSKDGEQQKDGNESKDGSDGSLGDDQKQKDSDGKKSDGNDRKEPEESEPKSDKPGSKGESGKKSDRESQPGKSGQEEQQDGGQQPENQGEQQQSGEESPQRSAQNSSEPQKKTPGREEIEKAKKEMEQAIEKLKKLNADAASGHQDEAVRKLQEAKEKLEEILRQLREEERELMLAALEARFQKMLALQIAVYNGTVSLDKTPKADWSARHFGTARSLANDEHAISIEASKALALLMEEGSSVAFPEGVEQIREDMLSVARLLERTETGELTQGTERDIIESLEELVEALQKEMEKKKNDQQQQQQEQMQLQMNQALVDEIAELKMLRSLQLRINRRTKRLGALVKGEQATDPEIVEQLQSLSRRQAQVQQATYHLASGKDK